MKKLLFIIGTAFLASSLSLFAASGYFGGGMYIDEATNSWGIGTTSPSSVWKWSVVGSTFLSDLFLGLGVCNGVLTTDATGKVVCGPATSLSLATSTNTSVSNSSNKILTAWCPATYSAIGGGGQITAGNVDDITINMSFPTATTSGWTTEFRESDAVAGNWTARAHVVCIK